MKNNLVRSIMLIIVVVALAIAVLFGVYYGISYNSSANKLAERITFGNEYMQKEDYEAAISEYNLALDYDPENTEIKDAISHAYVMLAGTYGISDEAVDAYQMALTFNIENKNAYWGVANIFEERGDENNMLIALSTGYENTQDENMKLKIDNIEAEKARIEAEEAQRLAEEEQRLALEEAHNEVMSKIYDCFEAGNIDDVKEILREESSISLSDEIINAEDSFYYGDKDESGNRQGKGLAAYRDQFFYFGDFDNNIRSGKGIWIRAEYGDASSIGSFIYEGDFANDKPNGNGTATTNFYADKVGSSAMTKQVITGVYSDGLENGKMSLSGSLKSGKSVKYQYTSSNGVAEKSSKDDSGVKGQYIIAKSSDGSMNLTSDGSVRGVEGFTE